MATDAANCHAAESLRRHSNGLLTLGVFGNGVRGVEAAVDIAAGDVLLRLPAGVMLLPCQLTGLLDDCAECGPAKLAAPAAAAASADPRVSLALSLAHELTRGQRSRMFEYAACLPRCESSACGRVQPALAAAECRGLRLLAGRLAERRSEAEAREPEAILARMLRVHGAGESRRDRRRLWRRCWELVNTRIVHCPVLNSIALVPYFDLFNHSPAADASVSFADSTFFVTTATAYKRGDQVFINYGCHSNMTLLIEYGFVCDAASEHDRVPVDIRRSLRAAGPAVEKLVAELGQTPLAAVAMATGAEETKFFNFTVDGPSYCLILLAHCLATGESAGVAMATVDEESALRRRSVGAVLLAACDSERRLLLRDRNRLLGLPGNGGDSPNARMLRCVVQLIDIWCDILNSAADKMEAALD